MVIVSKRGVQEISAKICEIEEKARNTTGVQGPEPWVLCGV